MQHRPSGGSVMLVVAHNSHSCHISKWHLPIHYGGHLWWCVCVCGTTSPIGCLVFLSNLSALFLAAICTANSLMLFQPPLFSLPAPLDAFGAGSPVWSVSVNGLLIRFSNNLPNSAVSVCFMAMGYACHLCSNSRPTFQKIFQHTMPCLNVGSVFSVRLLLLLCLWREHHKTK